METYAFLRNFADSWHLLFMTVLFIGIGVWAFRPGSKAVHSDAADQIFRNDDTPASDTVRPAKEA